MADILITASGEGEPARESAVDSAGRYQPGKAWGVAAALTVFASINFLDKVVLGMVAVPLMRDLHLSPTEFGVVASSFFWLFTISAALVGFIGNRLPARWLLLGMALVWSVVQLPVIFAASATALLVGRVLLGAGEGPAFPVSVHALYKWFPHEKRNLPVALISQGAVIGMLVAGLMVPYITQHWGWRANFIVLGTVSLLWALGWLCWGREGTLHTVIPASAGGNAERQRRPVPYRKLLTDATVLCSCVTGFAAYWGSALTLTWLPAFLERGLGYDSVTAGRMFAVIVAVGTPAAMALSWCSQSMLKRGVSSRIARCMFSCGCVGIGGLILLLFPSIATTPGGRVAMLAVASTLPPLAFSLGPAVLGEIVPDAQRSGMIALYTAVSTCAGAIAPIVMGRVLQTHGGSSLNSFEFGFMVCGAVMVAGAVVGVLGQDPARSLRNLRD
ncbi:MFS transporter [Cupriavidus sp. BIS7]|uniref:MFS transporter n=1 Tax=Cupriavidus sp. BIS7 TaxID=1217718 RepID=UPI0002D41359|nr:MFS transporter [Cupriavidus sp. BIS7]